MDTITKGFVNNKEFDGLNTIIEQHVNVNPNMKVQVTSLYDGVDSKLTEISELFSTEFNKLLLETLNNADWIPVGLDGIKDNYKEGDTIGSYRLSIFNELLADKLTAIIKTVYDKYLTITETTYTDSPIGSVWELDGINPLFRFIRYEDGGLLVPHYDGSYKPSDDYRSLVTLVIYLEGGNGTDDGCTRFIRDANVLNGVSFDEVDRSDWSRLANEDEIICSSNVVPQKAILFDHWLLHDSKPLIKNNVTKTIIRTDLMYRKVSDY